MTVNFPLDELFCIQFAMDRCTKSSQALSKHRDFLLKVQWLAMHAAFHEIDRSAPVLRWRNPEQLKKIIPLDVGHGVASTDEELLVFLENVVKFSTKTGHPHFCNQLFSGLDPYGLAGQIITDALNPSIYTYEVAPVFTLMEEATLSEMLKMIGFQNGDGMFCPGGSLANGFAINLARHRFFPSVKKHGMPDVGHLVLFASEDAHYSVHKMCALLGLGESNVISVSTDETGRMDPDALLIAIDESTAKGFKPFLVFATAGTTVLGAFDPISELATISAQHKLWLHVDAAWGGGLLFSRRHRHLLNGIELADSVTWNPHKLLGVPQQCSTLLLREKGALLKCHSQEADYLFQKDKFYDTDLDVGDKYLQCGRRADVLKFWLMWKAKGSEGFEKHVDHLMEISQHLLKKVKSHQQFQLVAEPQFVNICFWFIPRALETLKSHPDYYQMLHKVAPEIKEGMLRRGTMMINYQPLKKWPNFFRFVVQNSSTTKEDIDFFVEEIIRIGDSNLLQKG